jgi:hypothetical protein
MLNCLCSVLSTYTDGFLWVNNCWGIRETRHPRNVEVNEICDVSFQKQRTHEDLESETHKVSESRTHEDLESKTHKVSESRTREDLESETHEVSESRTRDGLESWTCEASKSRIRKDS